MFNTTGLWLDNAVISVEISWDIFRIRFSRNNPPSWKREILHVIFTTIHKNNQNGYLENLYFSSFFFIKIEVYTKPNNVWSLHFKQEVFIWRHVVYVPKSSTIFRGILICMIFRHGDMQEYIFMFSIALEWR